MFKLFFRALWEIASIPLEALLPAVVMVLSIALLFLPFLVLFILFFATPSIFESFAIGYFGAKFIRNQRNHGWGMRFLRGILSAFLVVVVWIIGYVLSVDLVVLSTANAWVMVGGGLIGAVLFRRYIVPWIVAGFRSTPWVFRQLRAAF